MPAIEVEDLHVRFGAVRAVSGVSFSVEKGEVVTLLGPNGAGKTTTVETLEGYRTPTAGRVRVLGLDPGADHRALVGRVGVMLQSGGVYPGIRPIEALELFASYYDSAENPRLLLERVGLGHVRTTTYRRLSGGEQQRLSLALALVGQPEVAFLDEPTAGIDVNGRQLIRDVIRELRQNGTTVLLTTHDLEEAERTSDRIVIIDKGRLVACGTAAQLLESSGADSFQFAAAAGLDTADLGRALGGFVDQTSPGEYRVDLPPTPHNVAALTTWLATNDVVLGDLRAGRQRLEDVFLRLTEITGEVPVVRVEDDGSGRA